MIHYSIVLVCLLLAMFEAEVPAEESRLKQDESSSAVRVSYGKPFLIRRDRQIYSIEIKLGEEDNPDSIRYRIARVLEDGSTREEGKGAASERKGARSLFLKAKQWKLEWSRGSRSSGWLYLGDLKGKTEFYATQTESLDALDQMHWITVRPRPLRRAAEDGDEVE